jgi:hypothetical protein
MKSIIVLGLLSSAGLMAMGCGATGATDAEGAAEIAEFDQVSEALTSSYMQSGSMLFSSFALSHNCTLTMETSNATPARDPVLGLIINNGNSAAWGSPDVPCHRGSPSATDGYTTLAFGDDFNSNNRNAKFSYKNTSGGAPITVFAVGFIKEQVSTAATSYGTLPVIYSITGCTDSSKNTNGSVTINQDFQASGQKVSMSGYVFSNQPRPGGPQTQQDTVLYELDPAVNGGSGKCNDDCASGSYQSCISNNSGSSMWYFSAPWYGTGFTSVNN